MAPRSGKHGGKTIQAVETAMEVLAELRRQETATLAALDEALPHSKSTLHHHLATLQQAGFVESGDGTYRLGLRLLTYGANAREASDLYDVGRDAVDRLADETGELARLVAERDGAAVAIHQSAGDNVGRPWEELGSVQDLHCTAAGKAFLAGLPPEEVDDLLDEVELRAHTENTITDRAELEEQLAAVRECGVAFDDQECRDGVRCVAATVTTEEGDALGAITVAGPTDRVTDERFRTELPDQVRNVVGVVEVAATYADWGR